MRVRYGQYRLPSGATEVSINADPVEGARGLPVEHVVTWTMQTRLKNPGGNPIAFTQQLLQLQNAFNRHGQDLVLETEAGVPSFHRLISSQCIGGTRVIKPPTFPTGRRAQLVTHRDIEIVVQGRVPTLFGYSNYVSFQETITISGGGRRWGCREVNFGPGVRQQLRTHSKCVATQSGTAVGHLARPPIPPPIWPQALVTEFPDTTDVTPKLTGAGGNGTYSDFSRSWSYSYEFPFRLTGTPSVLSR